MLNNNIDSACLSLVFKITVKRLFYEKKSQISFLILFQYVIGCYKELF